jgi:hypothetical protein
MIMSAISSYDEALDFYPDTEGEAGTGTALLGKLRVLWEAMAEGHAAAYRYRELIAHGRSADQAASQVFTEFYAR